MPTYLKCCQRIPNEDGKYLPPDQTPQRPQLTLSNFDPPVDSGAFLVITSAGAAIEVLPAALHKILVVSGEVRALGSCAKHESELVCNASAENVVGTRSRSSGLTAIFARRYINISSNNDDTIWSQKGKSIWQILQYEWDGQVQARADDPVVVALQSMVCAAL